MPVVGKVNVDARGSAAGPSLNSSALIIRGPGDLVAHPSVKLMLITATRAKSVIEDLHILFNLQGKKEL
jgi:hypothetical protein